MNGNLAATGMHNSETEDMEWRYCFNEIELLIFGILNDTQVKLYNMLKLLQTHTEEAILTHFVVYSDEHSVMVG